MIMRVGRAEWNRAGAGLLWERCGRLELTVRVGGKLRGCPTSRALRDVGRGILTLATDACPFFTTNHLRKSLTTNPPCATIEIVIGAVSRPVHQDGPRSCPKVVSALFDNRKSLFRKILPISPLNLKILREFSPKSKILKGRDKKKFVKWRYSNQVVNRQRQELRYGSLTDPLDPQLDHRGSAAPLVERWFRNGLHVRVLLQILAQGFAQDAHAAAMDDAHPRHPR